MCKDVDLSHGLTIDFGQYLEMNHTTTMYIESQIMLTQAGTWPINTNHNVAFSLPHDIELLMQQFQSFYATSYPKRRLQFLFEYSTGNEDRIVFDLICF